MARKTSASFESLPDRRERIEPLEEPRGIPTEEPNREREEPKRGTEKPERELTPA